MKPRGTFNASPESAPPWCRFRCCVDWDGADRFARYAEESRATGRQWVLYLATLPDFSPLRDHAQQLRQQLVESGLLPHVRGVCLSEEWYERAFAGQMPIYAGLSVDGTVADNDLYAVAEAIAGHVGSQHALLKRLFPELATVWLTTLAHPSRQHGPWYYRPVPAHTDCLALDAYVPKGATFAKAVDPVYAAAIAQTALPIVSIPQGFRTHDATDMWSDGPTPAHVRAYERWLQHPRVISQMWFDWDSRASMDGLDALPEIREAIDALARPPLALADLPWSFPEAPRVSAAMADLAAVPARRTPGLTEGRT